jgi:hypothetical protein
MIGDRCPREDELLDALARGFTGPELAGHAAACRSCSELHQVAGALLDERLRAVTEAPVPAAGTMWWRIQSRQRREAQAAARRTLLIGQAATLGIALALIASFFGSDIALEARQVIASIRFSSPLLLTLTAWLLIAPIAGYVAIRQK